MKGISKRVVVVYPREQSVFEEAIFVLREGASLPPEAGREAVLREAERAAGAFAASAAEGGGQTCICRLISRLSRSMMRFSSRLM